MRKMFLIGVALATVAAKNPNALPSAQPITASDRTTGAKAHPELLKEFGGLYDGPQAAYVTRIGQKIAVQSGLSNTQSDFKISLLNSPVNNAFAIPGGYVYVTRQLVALMNSEAELASVMGHEIGHVAARHAQKRNTRATYGGIGTVLGAVLGGVLLGDGGTRLGQQLAGSLAQRYVLKYSRTQEYQADDLGVSYLGRAGYDPLASSSMLAALAGQTTLDAQTSGREAKSLPEWASTHPDPASRVARARARAATTPATGRATNRDAFLAAIDGMLYGDDPRQGVVEGREFKHPDLKLGFTAPVGFTMSNTPQAVIVAGTGAQAQFTGNAFNGDLNAYIANVFKSLGGQNGVPFSEIRRLQVNGIPAAYATANATSGSTPVVVTVFAYEFAQNTAYHFVAIEKSGSAGTLESLFRSLRRLSPPESAAIRARIVDVVTVGAGDTVQSLAARMAYGDLKEERFRVLNSIPASTRVSPGQKVKLIVYR